MDLAMLCDEAAWLHRQGRLAEAEQVYQRILAAKPDMAEALYNYALTLWQLKRPDEALAHLDRAVAAKPNLLPALVQRGNVLRNLNRLDEALENYDRALTLDPDAVMLLTNRAHLLTALRRFDEAAAGYRRALALQPGTGAVKILNALGTVLRRLQRFDEARTVYEQALALEPENPQAFSGLAHVRARLLDWKGMAQIQGKVETRARAGLIPPSLLFAYSGDPLLQRSCAEAFVRQTLPAHPSPLWSGAPYGHDRIRIAYLSADFHNHATALLMAELFERHDRGRFEILALSFGPDDGSPMRARLTRAFGAFHDVRRQSDAEVAQLLRAREVDIAIDLKGFTADARPKILQHRPCPVQVNYLGFPGTMGADFIDYILADATLAPMEHQSHFREKIVQLPDSYQANDAARAIAPTVPKRAEAGLPETAFVFCCFNSGWKITPAMFATWMRLLASVPSSVLWLLDENNTARQNLREAAQALGVDPARLIFAPRIEAAAHLARHTLADLFLDTLPCNAHTTASDALWAGLPIVTQLGEAFCGRVAASLLRAVGLDDLVATSAAEYEALALALARDPARLAALRDELVQNRARHSLFDGDRFRRNIEAAYTRMHELVKRGAQPLAFAV